MNEFNEWSALGLVVVQHRCGQVLMRTEDAAKRDFPIIPFRYIEYNNQIHETLPNTRYQCITGRVVDTTKLKDA